MHSQPYASTFDPGAAPGVGAPPAPPVMRASTMGRRFGAYLIDACVIGPVMFVVWIVTSIVAAVANGGSWEVDSSTAVRSTDLLISVFVFLCIYSVPLAYHALLPTRKGNGRGRTLGKSALNLRVVAASGGELTAGQAIKRGLAYAGPTVVAVVIGPLLDLTGNYPAFTLVAFVGQLIYGLVDNAIVPFSGDTRQTLHDRIAGTVVIDDRFTTGGPHVPEPAATFI